MPQPDHTLLEFFDSPTSAPGGPGTPGSSGTGRDFVIEHAADEFTSVCPKTGHPDFGAVTLRYCPAQRCVELKSLKLYYQSFRNCGIYYEAVTNQIADHLAAALEPKWMIVETNWKGRGGIRSVITVAVGDVPPHELRR